MKQSMLGRLLRNASGIVGLVLISLYLVAAVCGALGISPHPADAQNARDRLQPPGTQYIMGTDEFGRDLFSRVLRGASNSLLVGFSAVIISGLLGTLLGILAGWFGGRVDNLIMRVMDLFFAFPAILLALAIITALGPGLQNTIVAVALVYLPIFARVARGPVLAVKEFEFVLAAQCTGASDARILRRHVLPNITAPLIVQVSLALSWAILTEAGLSFLGLGVQPPEPSWGSMLSQSRQLMELAPWLAIVPGIAIMLCVLGFNLLGDGLRDVLDPRLRAA